MTSHFSHIEEKDLGGAAAVVDISTGQLAIDPRVMDPLPDYWKKYVYLHEAAHLTLKTTDEAAATAWALDHYGDFSTPAAAARDLGHIAEIISITDRSKNDPRLQALKKTFAAKNPTKAAFWELVLTAVDVVVGGMIETSETETKNENTVYQSNQVTYQGTDEMIEDQRKQKVKLGFLPWLTGAIIVIALIVVMK